MGELLSYRIVGSGVRVSAAYLCSREEHQGCIGAFCSPLRLTSQLRYITARPRSPLGQDTIASLTILRS